MLAELWQGPARGRFQVVCAGGPAVSRLLAPARTLSLAALSTCPEQLVGRSPSCPFPLIVLEEVRE